MKDDSLSATQVVQLDDTHGQQFSPKLESSDADAEAVAKLGLRPTVPRTLDRLIGLIGLNSSVVCPWPSYVFVSVLNLGT